MEEVIKTMIQVFIENRNEFKSTKDLIEYYLTNKQTPFGHQANEVELRKAILILLKNGTIEQDIKRKDLLKYKTEQHSVKL